ncbi:MAG: hypothetical protein KAS23_05315, partial [Anaerohalosphaera sp.]|nr:hypothetical protein [Anaerohalosphaera sp.]
MHQKKRIILNVLSNYGGFVTEGVLTFILVGYVIRQLGKESFGLVSLAASLTVMTNFLVTGITQALTKHVAVSIESDNDTLTHELFNTSLLWFTSIGLISAGLIFVLGMFVERLFEIPVELVSVAHCAMFLMALKVLICFPFSSFQGILRAYQRYDLINAARVLAIIVRLGLTILVFELLSKGILQFIVVIILSIVAERILWVVFSVRVGYRPQFKMSYVTKSSLYMLLGFGSIILVINVANLLGYEAVKWVIGSKLSVTDV